MSALATPGAVTSFGTFALSVVSSTSVKTLATSLAATTKAKSGKVKKLSKGGIIGLAVGLVILVIILLIITIFVLLYIRRSKAKAAANAADHEAHAVHPAPASDANAPTYEKGVQALAAPQSDVAPHAAPEPVYGGVGSGAGVNAGGPSKV